jgi:hypothetical protein
MSLTVQPFLRAKILADMAQGLLCRIYLVNSIMQSPNNEKPAFLVDPELTKIRAKIDKSFPEIPDLSKSGGIEILAGKAPTILEGLAEYEDVLIGVVDFARAAEPLLQDIPRELLDIRVKYAISSKSQ